MKYSKRFRESVSRKVLPPESKRVSLVAEEIGISTVTILLTYFDSRRVFW